MNERKMSNGCLQQNLVMVIEAGATIVRKLASVSRRVQKLPISPIVPSSIRFSKMGECGRIRITG